MGKRPNFTRRCPGCGTTGKQTQHESFSYHAVRHIECPNRRCRKRTATLELLLGAPTGRGPRVGQARRLLHALLTDELREAKADAEARNVRYAELIESGALLETNAIRTCISCGEPGRALYSSSYGLYRVHAYLCTDKECAERWLGAEYSMGEIPAHFDLRDLTECLRLVRATAAAIDDERQRERAAKRAATSAVHAERARLLEELERYSADPEQKS